MTTAGRIRKASSRRPDLSGNAQSCTQRYVWLLSGTKVFHPGVPRADLLAEKFAESNAAQTRKTQKIPSVDEKYVEDAENAKTFSLAPVFPSRTRALISVETAHVNKKP